VHFEVSRAGKGADSGRLRHMIEMLRPAADVDLGGLSADDLAFIKEVGCPLVPTEQRPQFNSWIGRLQADHLHSRGYTEIAFAFLSDAREDLYGLGRVQGVAEFCAAEGLAPPAHIHVPVKSKASRLALERLIEERGRPVGIACYNDQVALALVFAAQHLGLAVPDEIAVIGMERSDVGQVVSPRLTTVAAEGRAAVRHFRHSLAETYGGARPDDETPTPDEAFTVVQGETT